MHSCKFIYRKRIHCIYQYLATKGPITHIDQCSKLIKNKEISSHHSPIKSSKIERNPKGRKTIPYMRAQVPLLITPRNNPWNQQEFMNGVSKHKHPEAASVVKDYTFKLKMLRPSLSLSTIYLVKKERLRDDLYGSNHDGEATVKTENSPPFI